MESEFPLHIVRTRRKKSVSIRIIEGQVRVLIPKRLSQRRLQQILDSKTAWIRQKMVEQATQAERSFQSGESLPYLGRNYRLQLISEGEFRVKRVGGQLRVGGVDPQWSERERVVAIRTPLQHWYRVQAERWLRQKTTHYAALLRVIPTAIEVRHYKSRWGSCSSGGVIRYNSCIMLAPHAVVDYLVVHELCHLLEMNHSAAFWRRVEQIMPDYRQQRAWLKRFQMEGLCSRNGGQS